MGRCFLANVAVVDFPKDTDGIFRKARGRTDRRPDGLERVAQLSRRARLCAFDRLLRVSAACSTFPDFDVIGLILRPEDDGRFTILGVADFEGKPSCRRTMASRPGDHLVAVDGIPVHGSTMGQVWTMLGGTPGQERKLTIERGGQAIHRRGEGQHFLGELPDEKEEEKEIAKTSLLAG